MEKLTAKLRLYDVIDFMGRDAYGIGIQLYDENREPYVTLTVSFGEVIGIKNAAYVDTNNFPQAIAYIEENHLGIKTPYTKQSGFCEYPLVLFDEDYLKSLDEKMYKKYSDAFDTVTEF